MESVEPSGHGLVLLRPSKYGPLSEAPALQRRALRHCRCLQAGPEERIPVAQALGAVASRPVIGTLASPAFNNAAMDGYALCSHDTEGATLQSPVTLAIAGELKAGAYAEAPPPEARCALRVATGAHTPPPLDAVLPLEQADVIDRDSARLLRLRQPVEAGRNLRRMGEEYASGATFDFVGQRLHAGHMALLSAAGVDALHVRMPASLALFTTGGEVRPPARLWLVAKSPMSTLPGLPPGAPSGDCLSR